MTTMAQRAARDAAREKLRDMLAGRDRATVYTVLRHVSSSGMSRDISLMVVDGGRVRDITYTAAEALGERVRDVRGHRAIRVGGCGMDMGFHLVYSLSAVLYAGQDRAGYVLDHEWL